MGKLCKKIAPEYFELVRLGIKKIELRRDDCDYQTGDLLVLQEYDDGYYTGHEILTRITYKLENYTGLLDGWCILGIEVLE